MAGYRMSSQLHYSCWSDHCCGNLCITTHKRDCMQKITHQKLHLYPFLLHRYSLESDIHVELACIRFLPTISTTCQSMGISKNNDIIFLPNSTAHTKVMGIIIGPQPSSIFQHQAQDRGMEQERDKSRLPLVGQVKEEKALFFARYCRV